MKRHMGSKFGVVWLILSLIILAPGTGAGQGEG